MMKLYRNILAAAVLVLTAGCIKEDLTVCDNVTVYFRYPADGEDDVLAQYMSKVDLYVFDAEGRLRSSRSYNQDELTNHSAKPSFRLEPGRYTVVALGNDFDNTEVVNLRATSLGEIFFQNPAYGDEAAPIITHDDNYLGQHVIDVPRDLVMQHDTVTLRSSHVDVMLEIKGLESPAMRDGASAPQLPVEVSFEQSNAQTDFNNDINTAAKGTIYPTIVWDDKTQSYHSQNLRLFRLDDRRGNVNPEYCTHRIVVRDAATGDVLSSTPLLEYLEENSDRIDVTRQEALLPIELSFMNGSVSVTVPQWVIDGDVVPDWE